MKFEKKVNAKGIIEEGINVKGFVETWSACKEMARRKNHSGFATDMQALITKLGIVIADAVDNEMPAVDTCLDALSFLCLDILEDENLLTDFNKTGLNTKANLSKHENTAVFVDFDRLTTLYHVLLNRLEKLFSTDCLRSVRLSFVGKADDSPAKEEVLAVSEFADEVDGSFSARILDYEGIVTKLGRSTLRFKLVTNIDIGAMINPEFTSIAYITREGKIVETRINDVGVYEFKIPIDHLRAPQLDIRIEYCYKIKNPDRKDIFHRTLARGPFTIHLKKNFSL